MVCPSALGSVVTRSAHRWMKGRGPWRGRRLKQNVTNLLWVAAGWLGLLGLYLQVMSLLGVANAFWSWVPLIILGILVMTNSALVGLFQETWKDMNSRSQPSDSFLVKLWKVDSLLISRRVWYFFTALACYATL